MIRKLLARTNVAEIVRSYGNDRTRLMDIFWDIQDQEGHLSQSSLEKVASELGISLADAEEVRSFYHFFLDRPCGKYRIYLDTSIVAEFAGMPAVKAAFEHELGIKVGSTTADGEFGLFDSPCMGMSDQAPAALINFIPFTQLTPARVKTIVAALRGGKSPDQLVKEFGYGDGRNASDDIRSMVRNHVYRIGSLFQTTDRQLGRAGSRALGMSSDEIISEILKSGLRGRGGAGFHTGKKWEACRAYPAAKRYVVCNADEGEPGTFKDRFLLTEAADLMFEGMAICAKAIGAEEGVIYLRAEYRYLVPHLQRQIEQFMLRNELRPFSLRIQLGAGAYVCGEESALLESMEGKRGEVRMKPPFPVEKGYLGYPTVVNNVETFALAAQVIALGVEKFRSYGTNLSPGTRLLSISGDVQKPGVYEVPWGIKIGEVLQMAGAIDPAMVQVGGPSGTCIRASDVDREVSHEDLATGGSFMVFSRERDLFRILTNFMQFFVDESCGNCTPCRAGNVVLLELLHRFKDGKAREEDLAKIDPWSAIVSKNSRCGLGGSSPRVLTTSKQAFPELYAKAIDPKKSDLFYDFDTKAATATYDRVIEDMP